MGGVSEILSEVSKWISDNRRLRVVLISTVIFGFSAGLVDYFKLAPEISHVWFLGIYAAASFCLLILLIFVLDVVVVQGYEQRKRKSRSLSNFDALSQNHKLCFVYLKQNDKRVFVDENYVMLRDLVDLGVLKDNGGPPRASVYEVPKNIWLLMQEPGWGNEYAKIGREPWHPENLFQRIS